MSNKARNTSGKFAAKSEIPRKVRSVNLTDTAWQWLAEVAAQAGVSRNDYLEALAESSNPFIEMVEAEIEIDDASTAQQPNSEALPLMEMVQAELEEAKAKNQTWREAFKELEAERNSLEWEAGIHRASNQRLRAELEAAKNAPVEIRLPEAANLLNRLKAKLKKSKASLADIQAILEMIEASQDDTSQEN